MRNLGFYNEPAYLVSTRESGSAQESYSRAEEIDAVLHTRLAGCIDLYRISLFALQVDTDFRMEGPAL